MKKMILVVIIAVLSVGGVKAEAQKVDKMPQILAYMKAHGKVPFPINKWSGEGEFLTADAQNVYLNIAQFQMGDCAYEVLGRFIVRRDGKVIGWQQLSSQMTLPLILVDFIKAREASCVTAASSPCLRRGRAELLPPGLQATIS